MEYFRLILGLLPKSLGGRFAIGSVGLLGLGYILKFPINSIVYHTTEKYRLSVCWDHYSLWEESNNNNILYKKGEITRRLYQYYECLHSARKGLKIMPPAI